MPKSFFLESVRHHLLRAIERARPAGSDAGAQAWRSVATTLEVVPTENRRIRVKWSEPIPGSVEFSRQVFHLYQRGDDRQKEGLADPVYDNQLAADDIVRRIGRRLELCDDRPAPKARHWEERFHDEWAISVKPEDVLVEASFQAATAPENRHALRVLGELSGLSVLDLGSGLGEGAVYFAKQGARVTACDVSSAMLDTTGSVARLHGVSVSLHKARAENTGLPDQSFDVVYAANVLHHADLEAALDEIRRVLRPGGKFVTWDPLGHNPLLDVYRRLARPVRTPDEHPLKIAQLELFKSRFSQVHYKGLWLCTQLVFIRFYLWDRVHPSRERYWKKIISEADRLSPFYLRLERIDNRLLGLFPWLQRYCWNVVVWGQK